MSCQTFVARAFAVRTAAHVAHLTTTSYAQHIALDEFYTALLLDALGLPRALFTPLFAVGRVAGWTAHAMEHHARAGRLIRPEALYDGARPEAA